MRSYCVLTVGSIYMPYVFWRCAHEYPWLLLWGSEDQPLCLKEEEEGPQPHLNLSGAPWNQGVAIILLYVSGLQNRYIALMLYDSFCVKVTS